MCFFGRHPRNNSGRVTVPLETGKPTISVNVDAGPSSTLQPLRSRSDVRLPILRCDAGTAQSVLRADVAERHYTPAAGYAFLPIGASRRWSEWISHHSHGGVGTRVRCYSPIHATRYMTKLVSARTGGVICVMLTALVRVVSSSKRSPEPSRAPEQRGARARRHSGPRPRLTSAELDSAYAAAARDDQYMEEMNRVAGTWDRVSADGLSAELVS